MKFNREHLCGARYFHNLSTFNVKHIIEYRGTHSSEYFTLAGQLICSKQITSCGGSAITLRVEAPLNNISNSVIAMCSRQGRPRSGIQVPINKSRLLSRESFQLWLINAFFDTVKLSSIFQRDRQREVNTPRFTFILSPNPDQTAPATSQITTLEANS